MAASHCTTPGKHNLGGDKVVTSLRRDFSITNIWVEEVIMRASDFTFAFPALLSAIMLTAIYGPGLVVSIVAIGIFNIPVFARISRGAANAVWARDYTAAARAAGKGPCTRAGFGSWRG